MDQTSNLQEAIARYHVLYGTFPEKAIIPEKDYADTLEGVNLDKQAADGKSFLIYSHTHQESAYVRVSPGKTSAVSLFHKKGE